jgi:putative methyltransferase (TIGR04325 family)
VPGSTDIIPVVLIAYARPAHLRRTLACLRTERVPLLYAFADGAKGPDDRGNVATVREILHAIDWCDCRVVERPHNLGLGTNVMAAVDAVSREHAAFIVWEDDLICVPGTYAWVCAALRQYVDEPRVMSVTAWTHPSVTPASVTTLPYFDGRAECLVWGAYARSWPGMERTAADKIASLTPRGVPADRYGSDLVRMARAERRRNLWAVRWLCHHLEHDGLCVRPPWSMVEHIGFDETATNSALAGRWSNTLRPNAPPIPAIWPAAVEAPECSDLWRRAYPPMGALARLRMRAQSGLRRALRAARSLARAFVPESIRRPVRALWGWRWFRGDYPTWSAAQAASKGYGDAAILERVLSATLAVRAGQAAFERDGVLFQQPEPDAPLMTALQQVRALTGGRLRVLDFGGSLGSTYWRHRELLPQGELLVWDVVEQPCFVAAGRQQLGGEAVRFFNSVEDAEADVAHDVLLCSGVLQYLEDPAAMLAKWRTLSIPYLLLNNVPLHDDRPDRLRVQHVPPSIYPATYPVWFFNRRRFMAQLEPYCDIVQQFASEAVWPVDFGMYPSTGLLLRRKTSG